MANETENEAPEQRSLIAGVDKERNEGERQSLLAAATRAQRVRGMRAQLLRLAATSAENPLEEQVEKRLLNAAQELQVAGTLLEELATPGGR
jgi:hypothetical protein